MVLIFLVGTLALIAYAGRCPELAQKALSHEAGTAYDLIHPKTGKVVGQLDARDVFRKIIHGAWKTGEPGVFVASKAGRTALESGAGQALHINS